VTRETEILKIDSRGRIVIPRTMRKSLALKENSQIMMICDSDNKELKIIPLPFTNEQVAIKMKILIKDKVGALARIAQTFSDLGISLLYGETVVIKKGEEAEWTVIAPVSEMSLEEMTHLLKEKGGAIRVMVVEPQMASHTTDEEGEDEGD
jgi:AbrB family looped-hinge helix DNA binding protein